MKKLLTAVALVATAFTVSAAPVVGLEYGYTRASNPLVISNSVVATAREAYSFGNIELSLGSVNTAVSGASANNTVYGIEYSYNFKTKLGTLSPAVAIARTGDYNVWGVGATLRTPIATATRLTTSVAHSQLFGSAPRGRATGASVGAELDLSKNWMLKGAYNFTRQHTAEQNANGVSIGIEYRF